MAKGNAAQKANESANDGENFESLVPASKLPLLAALAVASAEPNGFLYIDPADSAKLVELELALADPAVTNDDKQVATRLSDKGMAYAQANPAEPDNNILGNQGNNQAATDAAKERQSTGYKRPENITLEKGVALPSISRGRTGETSYPFDTMEVNDSFHIPATDANKDPAKSVASSVSTANVKYSEEEKDAEGKTIMVKRKVRVGKTGSEIKEFPKRKPIRQFTIRSVGAEDPKGPGCRVWRIM